MNIQERYQLEDELSCTQERLWNIEIDRDYWQRKCNVATDEVDRLRAICKQRIKGVEELTNALEYAADVLRVSGKQEASDYIHSVLRGETLPKN